jgi:hypothetical protein
MDPDVQQGKAAASSPDLASLLTRWRRHISWFDNIGHLQLLCIVPFILHHVHSKL